MLMLQLLGAAATALVTPTQPETNPDLNPKSPTLAAHLGQDARRQTGRIVVGHDRHRALQQHRARVVCLVHEMHRSAAEARAAVEDGLRQLL